MLGLALLSSNSGYGQKAPIYNREISTSELIKEIIESPGDKYELRNTIITADSFTFDDTVTINKTVLISHCRYENTRLLSLENIHFKGTFIIFNVDGLGIFFKNCTFDKMTRWDFSNTPNAVFNQCKFKDHFNFFNTSGALQFVDCAFEYTGDQEDNYFQQLNVDPWNKTLNRVGLKRCQFRTLADTQLIYLTGDINNVEITDCHFQSQLSFYDCSINQSFVIENTHFELPVGFDRTMIPEIETTIRFDQLAGYKIALMRNFEGIPYQALGNRQLADSMLDRFNELISIYSKLYGTYKVRSDRVSANACYVEMKDLETRRLKFIADHQEGTTVQLNYQLNRFLKFFASYGTSPVRSVQISTYVILIFALCYFFVYSEWDRINRKFLLDRYSRFQEYLSSSKTLSELHDEEVSEDYEEHQQFKTDLERHKPRVPSFFTWLGKPLLFLSLAGHRFKGQVYKRTEILHGKWTELDPGKKALKGLLIGLTVVAYLSYLVLVRAINSTILSINSFSTLGFGDIPVKGISRYIAILEGFLGWFLLSIFSVSLISQILQG